VVEIVLELGELDGAGQRARLAMRPGDPAHVESEVLALPEGE
jgi:hypothetical protein